MFKTASIESGQFAPNSTLEFVIDWENQYLELGDYLLKLTAIDGNQKWSWDELPINKKKSLRMQLNWKRIPG